MESDSEFYCLHESPQFSIYVFVMKKGVVMPIHDHPGMSVFRFVFYVKK